MWFCEHTHVSSPCTAGRARRVARTPVSVEVSQPMLMPMWESYLPVVIPFNVVGRAEGEEKG